MSKGGEMSEDVRISAFNADELVAERTDKDVDAVAGLEP